MKMTDKSGTRYVDQNELRVNATLVVTVLITAFVINRWELVAFQAGVLFLTTMHLSLGPYIALYRHILRPAGIVRIYELTTRSPIGLQPCSVLSWRQRQPIFWRRVIVLRVGGWYGCSYHLQRRAWPDGVPAVLLII